MENFSKHFFEGGFGLERETLRLDSSGRLSQSLHPFDNLIISDGEVLYVHKNMEGTLYYLRTDDGYIFSTKPLCNGSWAEFPTTQLAAFKDGELLFTGTRHDNVFTSVMHSISVYDAMNI